MDIASYASSVSRQDQGWFLFGGYNGLQNAQKLTGIDSKWEKGPTVQEVGIIGQCVVQVITKILSLLL